MRLGYDKDVQDSALYFIGEFLGDIERFFNNDIEDFWDMESNEHEYRGWTITIEWYESDALKEKIEKDLNYRLDNNLFYDYCVYREEPEEVISFSEYGDAEAALDDAKITIDQFIDEEEKTWLEKELSQRKL